MQLAQGLWHSLKRQGAAEATDLIPPLLQGFSVGIYRKDFQQLWRKSDFLYNSVLTDHELEVLCFPLKDDFSQRLEMTLLQILTEGLVPPHLLNLLHTASTRVKGVGAACSSSPTQISVGFISAHLGLQKPSQLLIVQLCSASIIFLLAWLLPRPHSHAFCQAIKHDMSNDFSASPSHSASTPWPSNSVHSSVEAKESHPVTTE